MIKFTLNPDHWHDGLVGETLPWLMVCLGLLAILVWGFVGLWVAHAS